MATTTQKRAQVRWLPRMEILIHAERALIGRRGLNVIDLADELELHPQTIRNAIAWLRDRAGLEVSRRIDPVDRKHYWHLTGETLFTKYGRERFI